ncbi:unnamed protein product [Schistocephalus solidus]|uniref:Amiloride-sensitive sodium channel n=1 Tax=Schistocephalus solidus TaxID=70667 RepID=A0A183SD22_SCHSO|nr:unnamed protein product [Schistocephalus solidus]
MLGYTRSKIQRWHEAYGVDLQSLSFHGVAGPLVPLVKTICHPVRHIRLIWAIFCLIMSTAVVSSFTVVMMKYLTHVTVIRLDQTGLEDGVQPPSLTICLGEHRTTELEKIFSSIDNWQMMPGAQVACQRRGSVSWSSQTDGRSVVFAGTAHYNVSFAVSPPAPMSISVTEQVPYPPHDVCTTFKLNHSCFGEQKFWKLLMVKIQLADPSKILSRQSKVIIHEAEGFPLDNYGRYLYEQLVPGAQLNIFYSKNIQKNLNSRNRPCSSSPISVLGKEFIYDQAACQWKETCRHLHEDCHCYCPLELLKKIGRPEPYKLWPTLSLPGADAGSFCAQKCMHEQGLLLMNTSVCPFACYKTTYQKHNQFLFDDETELNSVKLMLMQSDAIETRVEEELYGLAKLFSEIGGLSSFFFGFSCLIIFDLLEACVRLWISWCQAERGRLRAKRKTDSQPEMAKGTSRRIPSRHHWLPLQPQGYFPGIPYTPHCLPLGDESPLSALRRKPMLALDEAAQTAHPNVELNAREPTPCEAASTKCQERIQQEYSFCATWVLEDIEPVSAFVEIKL